MRQTKPRDHLKNVDFLIDSLTGIIYACALFKLVNYIDGVNGFTKIESNS